MVVTVVAWVVGGHLRFMLAIASNCCPADLQGQKNKQKDGHIPFHKFDSSRTGSPFETSSEMHPNLMGASLCHDRRPEGAL